MNRPKGRVPLFVLLGLFLLAAVPFLEQPFHMDDRLYLEISQNILQHPFFPYDYQIIFEGIVAPDAGSHSHLPVTAYYLAFIRLINPADAEWIYHLFFWVFPLLAAYEMFRLSQRFTRYALATTSILIFCPPVLVHSHTLMSDVPLLSFWLLAIHRFLLLIEGSDRPRDWILCGCGLVLAAFASLLTAGLVLLLASLFFRAWRGGSLSTSRSYALGGLLTAPLLLWTCWYLRAFWHYDRFLLTNTLAHLGKRNGFSTGVLFEKIVSFTLNLGGITLFPLAIWAAWARKVSVRVFLLLFLLLWIPFSYSPDIGEGAPWTWGPIAIFALCFSTGLLAVWGVIRETFESGILASLNPMRDGRAAPNLQDALLLPWFWGIFLSCLLLYYAGAVRYGLLAIPPFILIWIRCFERRISDPYFRRNCVWLSTSLTVILGFAVARADYRFAKTYQEAAHSLIETYSEPDSQIWFTTEWGFRYYLEKGGARPLPRVALGPQPGDILIKPYLAPTWVTLFDRPPYGRFLKRLEIRTDTRIRLQSFLAQAGFYSTAWGLLPLSISQDQILDWVNVYQIQKEYDQPLPEAEAHW